MGYFTDKEIYNEKITGSADYNVGLDNYLFNNSICTGKQGDHQDLPSKSAEEVPKEITDAGQSYELADVHLVSAEKEQDEILHKEITATKSISNLVVKVAEFPLTQTVETEDGYKRALLINRCKL